MGLFGGLGNMLGSWGTIPDIIMGKDPKEALLDNLKAAAIVGTGMYVAPMLAGGSAAGMGGEAIGMGGEAAGTGLLGGDMFGGATLGTGSAQLGTPGLLGTGTAASGYAPELASSMMGQGSMSTAASSVGSQSPSWLATFEKYSKPVNSIMDAAQKGQQMAAANEPQQMPAPTLQHAPPDLNGLLQQGMQMQQSTYDEAEARRKLMQLFAQQMGA